MDPNTHAYVLGTVFFTSLFFALAAWLPLEEPEVTAAMRVQLSEPKLLRDLVAYLRECGCVAEQASASEIEVFAPTTASERAARMEVSAYLAAWRVRHEGVITEMID